MFRSITIAMFAYLAPMTSAQACSEIRFANGANSGEVSGRVGHEQSLCYTFSSEEDQAARMQLLGSDNTCVNVLGVADCQYDLSFLTERKTYRLMVIQQVRRSSPEYFTLRLTIE